MTPKDWDKIEKLLGPMADQKTVEAVKALVEGIETNLKGSLTANAVKKVQRGFTAVTESWYQDVTISSVDTTKAFVNVQIGWFNGVDKGTAIDGGSSYVAGGRLISPTKLRLHQRNKSGYWIAWEVIEFY